MKEYKEKELKYYLVANVIMFLILSKRLNISNIPKINELFAGGILVFIIYVYGVIADSLLLPKTKMRILFPFKKYAANDIFTKIRNNKFNDERINNESLKKYYSCIDDAQNENSIWYKIYLKYQENEKIKSIHKDFLITRDLASLSMFLIIIFVVCYILDLTISSDFIYLKFLICESFMVWLSARNNANRFVKEVIVVDYLNSN